MPNVGEHDTPLARARLRFSAGMQSDVVLFHSYRIACRRIGMPGRPLALEPCVAWMCSDCGTVEMRGTSLRVKRERRQRRPVVNRDNTRSNARSDARGTLIDRYSALQRVTAVADPLERPSERRLKRLGSGPAL